MRIQKFLRDRGLGSVRDCDAIVQSGRVFVNGVRLKSPTHVLAEGDEVVAMGHRFLYKNEAKEHIYLAFNKPKQVLCSHADPFGRRTLFDAPYLTAHKNLFYAGRLDFQSRGLVLLSSDGDFIHRLSHPSNGVVKEYVVRVNRSIEVGPLKKTASGSVVDGVRYAPFRFTVLRRDRLLLKLSEGKKREIRILLGSIGLVVLDLERTAIGPYRLDGLAEGKWRFLPPQI